MTESWIVPELGTDFTTNFSVMLRDYIYDKWSYTSLTGIEAGINKPATKIGQTNSIEFRAGLKDDFKQLQVYCYQGKTVTINHQQIGWKREERTTQVWVVTHVEVMGKDDETSLLRLMDEEIDRICGMYRQVDQTSGDMRGIKDLIYEGNDRVYGPQDDFAKSEWETKHSILLWYEKLHGEV